VSPVTKPAFFQSLIESDIFCKFLASKFLTLVYRDSRYTGSFSVITLIVRVFFYPLPCSSYRHCQLSEQRAAYFDARQALPARRHASPVRCWYHHCHKEAAHVGMNVPAPSVVVPGGDTGVEKPPADVVDAS